MATEFTEGTEEFGNGWKHRCVAVNRYFCKNQSAQITCKANSPITSLVVFKMGIHDSIAKHRLENLETLDNHEWGPPDFDSYLVTTCHKLRKKPIGEFSIEDLRIMIGQDIGSMFLVPLALEKLTLDPLCEGDMYPGDLLISVLRLPQDFWKRNPNLRSDMEAIVLKLSGVPAIVDDALQEFRANIV